MNSPETKPLASDSDYPQEEAEKCRDDLLGNLMRMPPKPRDEISPAKPKIKRGGKKA